MDSTRPKLIRGAEGQSSNRSVANLSQHLALTCPVLWDEKELHHILEPLSPLSMWSFPKCFEKLCFQSVFYFAPFEAMPLLRFHCQLPSDFGVMKVRKMCLKLTLYPAVFGVLWLWWSFTNSLSVIWDNQLGCKVRTAATSGYYRLAVWNIFWIIAVITRCSLWCVVTSGLDSS